MNKKLGQIVLVAIVGLTSVFYANAQEHVKSWKIVSNTLENGQSLKPGEAIASKNYIAVLQKDGNFCLYKLDSKAKYGNKFVKCTMTVGSEDKKGASLVMQKDGNLALYNSKGGHLWSTDTYRGGNEKLGGRLIMYDDGKLILLNKVERPIYDFQKGRLY